MHPLSLGTLTLAPANRPLNRFGVCYSFQGAGGVETRVGSNHPFGTIAMDEKFIRESPHGRNPSANSRHRGFKERHVEKYLQLV